MNQNDTNPVGGGAAHQGSAVGNLTVLPDQTWWTGEQLEVIQASLADGKDDRDPTRGELKEFLHQVQTSGLDPFMGQIRLHKTRQRHGIRYTPMTTIDGFRIVAERSGKYAGQAGPMWMGDDEVWRDYWSGEETTLHGEQVMSWPLAAKVAVRRHDWPEIMWVTAMFGEYCPTHKLARVKSLWASKPALMIAKCAEALALRKAFPDKLSRLYTYEEMMASHASDAQERRNQAAVDHYRSVLTRLEQIEVGQQEWSHATREELLKIHGEVRKSELGSEQKQPLIKAVENLGRQVAEALNKSASIHDGPSAAAEESVDVDDATAEAVEQWRETIAQAVDAGEWEKLHEVEKEIRTAGLLPHLREQLAQARRAAQSRTSEPVAV